MSSTKTLGTFVTPAAQVVVHEQAGVRTIGLYEKDGSGRLATVEYTSADDALELSDTLREAARCFEAKSPERLQSELTRAMENFPEGCRVGMPGSPNDEGYLVRGHCIADGEVRFLLGVFVTDCWDTMVARWPISDYVRKDTK